MKPRFSLKSLLVLLTVAAIFCAVRSQPARVAEEFRAAIADEDFQRADQLVAYREPSDLTRGVVQGAESFTRWKADQPQLAARVQWNEQSLVDWLRGHCRGTISVSLRGTDGTAELVGTAWGVELTGFKLGTIAGGLTSL